MENKEIYDMGFKVGLESRPSKFIKERFISLKECNQNEVLVSKLMEFLVSQECLIPEFFVTQKGEELGKNLTIYLMGLQNGSLHKESK